MKDYPLVLIFLRHIMERRKHFLRYCFYSISNILRYYISLASTKKCILKDRLCIEVRVHWHKHTKEFWLLYEWLFLKEFFNCGVWVLNLILFMHICVYKFRYKTAHIHTIIKSCISVYWRKLLKSNNSVLWNSKLKLKFLCMFCSIRKGLKSDCFLFTQSTMMWKF